MSVILSVQVAIGYTANPHVSVLHWSNGQKKLQYMKGLAYSSASFVKNQTKTNSQALEMLFYKYQSQILKLGNFRPRFSL